MKMYEDGGQVYLMVEHPGQRRVFGPFKSKPVPAMRWTSLDTTITTFFVGGTPVSIRETTRHSEKGSRVTEEVLAVPMTDIGGALALSVEGYLQESWDTNLKVWVLNPRPKASVWTGNEMKELTWTVE